MLAAARALALAALQNTGVVGKEGVLIGGAATVDTLTETGIIRKKQVLTGGAAAAAVNTLERAATVCIIGTNKISGGSLAAC